MIPGARLESMHDPANRPVTIDLWETVQLVTRAFDSELSDSGGSRPIWFVLLALKTRRPATQRELAAAIGIQEATLTHHLSSMERSGLVTRRRDAANRRVLQVALTDDGEKVYEALREVAYGFEDRLRSHLSPEELEGLRGTLRRLRTAVDSADKPEAPLPFE